MPDEIRILSLNLHKGFSSFNRRFVLHELRDAIREVKADLVFLQEVVGDHTRHRDRIEAWPESPQYEFLADSIWSDFAYGKNAVYQDGHHGNAILSRWPIKVWQNIDVSAHSSERRGILHCEIDFGGQRTIHALCVHFGLVEKFRREQLSALELFVKNKIPAEEPIIVAGDFNDWTKKLHKSLKESGTFSEAFDSLHGRLSKTFPSLLPLLPLDRIYVRHLAPLHEVEMPAKTWKNLSDHRPLCVSLKA